MAVAVSLRPLAQKKSRDEQKLLGDTRRSLIGSGDRSEKIRVVPITSPGKTASPTTGIHSRPLSPGALDGNIG